MTRIKDELSRICQLDNREYIESSLGNGPWITVDSHYSERNGNGGFSCALIPKKYIKKALSTHSWDFENFNAFFPGIENYSNKNATYEYQMYGNGIGLEPLIIHRDYFGLHQNNIEVNEEFRLLFNLYFNEKNNTYYKINMDGEEEEIVKINNSTVQIKLFALRQFLAIKEMHLGIYFDLIRLSTLSLDKIDLSLREKEFISDQIHYMFNIVDRGVYDQFNTNSRIIGKKIIAGCTKEECEIWPTYKQPEDMYESFIIGSDDKGKNVEYSCEPDGLQNYFGANPDAPHFLTPIFFQREVLTKYYTNTEKYSVEDGEVSCGGLWGLKIDNDHSKYVIVFLGYLGQSLSFREQKHWKSFNIPPDGTISKTSYKRGFLAEFTDPEKPDLLFKLRYTEFNSSWYEMYGWYFFLPLNKNDKHLLSSLRIPLNESQGEFDSQVSAITKIIVDCLNEKEFKKQITDVKPDDKGIDKLEKYLEFNKVEYYFDIIKFFRNLQELRSSSVAHRKGKNFEKIAQVFEMDRKNLSEVFTKILSDATEILQTLGNHFLNR